DLDLLHAHRERALAREPVEEARAVGGAQAVHVPREELHARDIEFGFARTQLGRNARPTHTSVPRGTDQQSMWKVVLLVLALFVLGHFAVRYVRVNPLGPVVEGNQVVVTSQEHELRYRRSGPVVGTYFVSGAETRAL